MKKIAEKMKSTGMLLAAVLRGAWESPWTSEKTLRRWRGIASAIWVALLSGSLMFLYQKSDLLSMGGAIAVVKCAMYYVTYILVFSFMLEVELKEKRAKLLKIWIVCCGVIIPLILIENLLTPETIRHTLSLVDLATLLLAAVPLVLRSHDMHLEKRRQIDEMDRLLRENREFLRDLEIMEKFSEPCRIDMVLPGIQATAVTVPKQMADLDLEELLEALPNAGLLDEDCEE